jgi:hypothetical protein
VHDVFHLLETFYSQKGHACYTTWADSTIYLQKEWFFCHGKPCPSAGRAYFDHLVDLYRDLNSSRPILRTFFSKAILEQPRGDKRLPYFIICLCNETSASSTHILYRNCKGVRVCPMWYVQCDMSNVRFSCVLRLRVLATYNTHLIASFDYPTLVHIGHTWRVKFCHKACGLWKSSLTTFAHVSTSSLPASRTPSTHFIHTCSNK